MKEFLNRIQATEEESCEELVAMANLSGKSTGLGNMFVYISSKQGSHGPRIKVGRTGKEAKHDGFSISISDNPEIKVGKASKDFSSKEIEQIFKWIKINKDLLLELWYDDELDWTTINQLKKV